MGNFAATIYKTAPGCALHWPCRSTMFRYVSFSRAQYHAGPTAAALAGTAVRGCMSTRKAPRVLEEGGR